MLRKVILVTLVVTLLLSVFIPNAFAASGVVKTPLQNGVVNLRTEPNSDNDLNILARVNNGTRIEILLLGSGWHQVMLVNDGTIGYMRDRYVAFIEETTITTYSSPDVTNRSDTIAKTNEVYSVTSESVNLRLGPDVTFGVKTTVNLKTKLLMLEKGSTWSKVRVLGQSTTGFINMQFIKQGIWVETTGNVNLRSLPNADSRIKREIAKGTALKVMVIGPEFSGVIVDNLKGWVSNKYLDF